MPRSAASWARAGAIAGPPPAAQTAIAVRTAIARAAGALCRVLLGVPSTDIRILLPNLRETSVVPGGGQRDLRSRLGHEIDAEYGNSGAGYRSPTGLK
jgi:hypothetical protein